MMATDGNIDGSSVHRTILTRDTDHAELHHPVLCQEHSRLRRYSITVHLPGTELDREVIVKDRQDRNHRSWTTINMTKHHILTYSTYVQSNSWTESNTAPFVSRCPRRSTRRAAGCRTATIGRGPPPTRSRSSSFFSV